MKKDLLLLVLLFILALVPSINYMKKEQSNFKNIIEYSKQYPEYNIDTNHINEYFTEYCQNMGISLGNTK